jgi:hypothetical protein
VAAPEPSFLEPAAISVQSESSPESFGYGEVTECGETRWNICEAEKTLS